MPMKYQARYGPGGRVVTQPGQTATDSFTTIPMLQAPIVP